MQKLFHGRWNKRIIKSVCRCYTERNWNYRNPLPVTFESTYFSLLILTCKTLNLSIYFRRRLSPNGEMKLPELPAEPVYDATLGEAKYKTSDRIIEARGYEPIHTEVTCIIVHLCIKIKLK